MTSIAPSIALRSTGQKLGSPGGSTFDRPAKNAFLRSPSLPPYGDGRMEGGLEGRPPSIGQLRSTPPIETDGSDGRLTMLDHPAELVERRARRRRQQRENAAEYQFEV
jgi:hypothetical protein